MNHRLLPVRPVGGKAQARQNKGPIRVSQLLLALAVTYCFGGNADAFRIFDTTGPYGLGVFRWNAAPHSVDGVERSLDGGLRYSIEGGSYAAFRDEFEWQDPAPSSVELQLAVEQAFASWVAIDPESGLGTDLYFVPDFATPAVLEPSPPGTLTLNPGAEIDIFGESISSSGLARIWGDPHSDSVTLTSGVQDYPAGVSSGADILMNTSGSSTDTPWTLDLWSKVLSHEIGHALGLADVDIPSDVPNGFQSFYYDDNYDGADDATALATLTNSFATLIDPFDPDNSPALMQYEPCNDSECNSLPGFDSPGVHLLLETSGQMQVLGPRNDEFAGRQFLYPYVPPQPGDFDGDGDVDGYDFLTWQRDPGIGELTDWQANHGAANSLSASQAVPEPTGILLITSYVVAIIPSTRKVGYPIR